MNDEKLSDIISNLEIVNHRLSKLETEFRLEGKAVEYVSESNRLVRQVIDELRNTEVTREINKFSERDIGG